MDLTWQLFWGTIPFLLLLIIIKIESPSYDIFLIPDGFRGEIVIEYDVKNGAAKEFEGKWRIYKIPLTGKLKTEFKIKGKSVRFSQSKYYYVDKNKNRKELKHFCRNCIEKDTTNVQVIPGGLGTRNNTPYLSFFIGIPNNEFTSKNY